MKVDIFDFELDEKQIALRPVEPRDSSKLLDLTNLDEIKDKRFFDIVDLINAGDVLVFNDTKVIPARLFGQRGQAKIQATLHKRVSNNKWWALVKNSKRLKKDQEIIFYNQDINIDKSGFRAIVADKNPTDGVLLEFNKKDDELFSYLEKFGNMPLPPYIEKQRKTDEKDVLDYQTVFAKHEGAVAAPTAGLHFTPEILEKLKKKDVLFANLTLHVGAGTFLPIKVEDTKDHHMHSEFGVITQNQADIINKAKQNGGKVYAVGTTALRLLESASDDDGNVKAFSDETDIFITPSYKFKIIDYLITNFHLPKSTLFMLVCAVAGIDTMHKAYEHAKNNGYRFYSYGDSSILKRR